MGTVYKARQLSMNRLVAIKMLHPRLAANPAFSQRLTREAHLAAKLSHNNIVQAIDVGSAGQRALLRHGVRRGHDDQARSWKGRQFPEARRSRSFCRSPRRWHMPIAAA